MVNKSWDRGCLRRVPMCMTAGCRTSQGRWSDVICMFQICGLWHVSVDGGSRTTGPSHLWWVRTADARRRDFV